MDPSTLNSSQAQASKNNKTMTYIIIGVIVVIIIAVVAYILYTRSKNDSVDGETEETVKTLSRRRSHRYDKNNNDKVMLLEETEVYN